RHDNRVPQVDVVGHEIVLDPSYEPEMAGVQPVRTRLFHRLAVRSVSYDNVNRVGPLLYDLPRGVHDVQWPLERPKVRHVNDGRLFGADTQLPEQSGIFRTREELVAIYCVVDGSYVAKS